MHALDAEIRRATSGGRSLDDAVRELAGARGRLTTASFLGATSHAAGRDLTPFFRRYVFRGERPPLEAPEAATGN
jgi:predicted metalloprotease with PDZ domain